MLVFELTKDNDQLEIHADEEGIRQLLHHLEHLLRREDHLHLKTKPWGGNELSDEPQGEGHTVLNHVKIFHWKG